MADTPHDYKICAFCFLVSPHGGSCPGCDGGDFLDDDGEIEDDYYADEDDSTPAQKD